MPTALAPDVCGASCVHACMHLLLMPPPVPAPAPAPSPRPQRVQGIMPKAGHCTQEHPRHGLVRRGLYVYQLEVWLRHFPPEQILVLHQEQVRETRGRGVGGALVVLHQEQMSGRDIVKQGRGVSPIPIYARSYKTGLGPLWTQARTSTLYVCVNAAAAAPRVHSGPGHPFPRPRPRVQETAGGGGRGERSHRPPLSLTPPDC